MQLDTDNDDVHGVQYPPHLLDSLPVLTKHNNTNPIRALPPSHFAALHLNHLQAHPPDYVLFPFLHGLEGDNPAQNHFFAQPVTAAQSHARSAASRSNHLKGHAQALAQQHPAVPRFRGLVWVVCDEDVRAVKADQQLLQLRRLQDMQQQERSITMQHEERRRHRTVLREQDRERRQRALVGGGGCTSEEDDGDGVLADEFDDDEDEDSCYSGEDDGMDVDNAVFHPVELPPITDDPIALDAHGQGVAPHMHPVNHRGGKGEHHAKNNSPHGHGHGAIGLSSSVITSSSFTSSSASSASSSSSSTSSSSSEEGNSLETPDESTLSTTLPTPTTPATPTQTTQPTPSKSTQSTPQPLKIPRPPPYPTRPSNPAPLLTSTFRPHELLCYTTAANTNTNTNNTNPNTNPNTNITTHTHTNVNTPATEFVRARVPDGISLRNFGIQVPIYATLSDIVVYSPKGVSPAACALAERFREAVDRKRAERKRRRRGCVGQVDGRGGDIDTDTRDGDGGEGEGEGDDGLVEYNVFVLDATAEEMQRELPHLIVRMRDEEGGKDGEVEVEGRSDGDGGEGLLGGEPTPTSDDTPSGTTDGAKKELHMQMDEMKTIDTMDKMDTDTDKPMRALDTDGGAHTVSTDGGVAMESIAEHDAKVGGGGGVEGRDKAKEMERRRFALSRRSNTVDFAQREKEEMRDLTRASEIISVGVAATGAATGASGDDNNKMGVVRRKNSIDRAKTGAVEVQTTATHWDPSLGQVFLGNSNDVPLAPPSSAPSSPSPSSCTSTSTSVFSAPGADGTDPFDYMGTNDPARGFGYDLCVECHDLAPLPGAAHLRAAEEHLGILDGMWAERCGWRGGAEGAASANGANGGGGERIPVRPPPHANAVIHLPFPSSPPSSSQTLAALLPVVRFLEKLLQPAPAPEQDQGGQQQDQRAQQQQQRSASPVAQQTRRWSSVSSLMGNFHTYPSSGRTRSFTSSAAYASSSRSPNSPITHTTPRPPPRTRPLKILIYSSDGYTESSVPALCLLMAVRGLRLPEAYLELQVAKRRSFFVYASDLGVLRRVEARLVAEREGERVRVGPPVVRPGFGARASFSSAFAGMGGVVGVGVGSGSGSGYCAPPASAGPVPQQQQQHHHYPHRPAAKSVSFAQSPLANCPPAPTSAPPQPPLPSPPMIVPSQNYLVKSRPRANTSLGLPSLFGDHQVWFNDPRFDGSFPSRVLPFLYLGNLNHATNAYMLHALGITHVVSVGECALVPPPHLLHYSNAASPRNGPGPHFVQGKGPGGQGSLWIEEREGRIKVLDIKGVCDDGIDSLEPQLEPICEWIDRARAEGGQVLVHCRVGVSRSATVTIAYVMKHLGLPLVDAYLIVRSRRLSVLIQPNMRLLYNLCGWEVKLARERAAGDEELLKGELARTLTWPSLAKEVHALNEKYLH